MRLPRPPAYFYIFIKIHRERVKTEQYGGARRTTHQFQHTGPNINV